MNGKFKGVIGLVLLAAIIGAVDDGKFENFKKAAEVVVKMDKKFEPNKNFDYERNYKKFNYLYNAQIEAARI